MGKKKEAQKEDKRMKPLNSMQGKYFQELVDTSNRYQAIMKQKEQYRFAIKQMESDRHKIQTGEIKGPFVLTIIPKVLSREVTDKKEILKIFDEQLKTYKKMVKALEGQLQHRYDEFVETGVRTRQFLEYKFGKEKVKGIVPDRKTGKDEEETLFEAEFEDLAKDPEIKKEFEKKKKEAIKKNVSRKTKKQSKKD